MGECQEEEEKKERGSVYCFFQMLNDCFISQTFTQLLDFMISKSPYCLRWCCFYHHPFTIYNFKSMWESLEAET